MSMGLKGLAALENERARKCEAAVEVLDYAVGHLTALGYEVTVACVPGAPIVLTLDLTTLDLTAPPAAEVRPAPAPNPAPAAAPEPRAAPISAPQSTAENVTRPAEPAPRRGSRQADPETVQVLDLLVQGVSHADIARRVGCTKKKIQNIKYRWKAQIAERIAEQQGGGPRSASADDPAPAQTDAAEDADGATRRNRGAAVIDHALMSGAEVEIMTHLDALGYAGVWSPQKDLALVEAILGGTALVSTAQRLGVTERVVKDRWRALNTNIGSLDHQARLLRVLQQRAGTRLAAE